MGDRIQLTDDNADKVVGGFFCFYTDQNGVPRCYVTGFGNFETSKDGASKYQAIRDAHPDLTDADYYEMCKNAGVIW